MIVTGIPTRRPTSSRRLIRKPGSSLLLHWKSNDEHTGFRRRCTRSAQRNQELWRYESAQRRDFPDSARHRHDALWENGAGTSKLLKLLAGVVEPNACAVVIEG